MKEFIVDYELYEDGVATRWLQNSFVTYPDDAVKNSAFDQFMNYAKEFWSVESRGGAVRIKNIWTVEG